MEGEIVKLAEIVSLKKKYKASVRGEHRGLVCLLQPLPFELHLFEPPLVALALTVYDDPPPLCRPICMSMKHIVSALWEVPGVECANIVESIPPMSMC